MPTKPSQRSILGFKIHKLLVSRKGTYNDLNTRSKLHFLFQIRCSMVNCFKQATHSFKKRTWCSTILKTEVNNQEINIRPTSHRKQLSKRKTMRFCRWKIKSLSCLNHLSPKISKFKPMRTRKFPPPPKKQTKSSLGHTKIWSIELF